MVLYVKFSGFLTIWKYITDVLEVFHNESSNYSYSSYIFFPKSTILTIHTNIVNK